MRFVPILVALAATACRTSGAAPPVSPCRCPEPPPAETPAPGVAPAPVVVVPAVVPAPLASRFEQGQPVDVLFHGTWYPATVVTVVGPERWEVAYDNYDSDYNLLVGPERVRERQPPGQSPQPQAGRPVRSAGELQVGMTVFVLYGSTRYPTLVDAITQDGQVRISYIGYGDQWDETVSIERLRMPP
jgi:hypothetical protein